MKKLTKNISANTSPIDIYNQMPKTSKPTFHEALRTLEAIQAVSKSPALFKQVVAATEELA